MRYSVGKVARGSESQEDRKPERTERSWFGGRRLGMGKESALDRRTRGIIHD